MAEVDANANAALKLTGYERIKDTSHRFIPKNNRKIQSLRTREATDSRI